MSKLEFAYSRETLGALMHVLRSDNSLKGVGFSIEMMGHLACLRVTFVRDDDALIFIPNIVNSATITFASRGLVVMGQRLEIECLSNCAHKHKLVYLFPLSKTDPIGQVAKVKDVARELMELLPRNHSRLIDNAVITTESIARTMYRYMIDELFVLRGSLLDQYSTLNSHNLLSIVGDATISPPDRNRDKVTADFNTVINGIFTNVILSAAQLREHSRIPYTSIRLDSLYVSSIPGAEPTEITDGEIGKILNEGERYVDRIASYG